MSETIPFPRIHRYNGIKRKILLLISRVGTMFFSLPIFMHFFANGFRAKLVRFRCAAPFLKKEQFAPKIFHKKQNNQTTTCGYENGTRSIWTEVLARNLGNKQYYKIWYLNMLLQIFAGMSVLNSLLLYHCQQRKGHKWIISLISSSGLLIRTITILEKETRGECYIDSSQIFQKKC